MSRLPCRFTRPRPVHCTAYAAVHGTPRAKPLQAALHGTHFEAGSVVEPHPYPDCKHISKIDQDILVEKDRAYDRNPESTGNDHDGTLGPGTRTKGLPTKELTSVISNVSTSPIAT